MMHLLGYNRNNIVKLTFYLPRPCAKQPNPQLVTYTRLEFEHKLSKLLLYIIIIYDLILLYSTYILCDILNSL